LKPAVQLITNGKRQTGINLKRIQTFVQKATARCSVLFAYQRHNESYRYKSGPFDREADKMSDCRLYRMEQPCIIFGDRFAGVGSEPI
jgi:hypothetical protein